MRRLDYHIHTKLCRHAIGEMDEYVQVALSKSLDEMGFSDHFIMVYLPQNAVQDDYCMKKEEIPIYINKVRNLQKKYADISIKLGIEVDYYEGKKNEIKQLLSPYEFDYIYCSIHVVDGEVIDDDRFRKIPYGNEIDELYKKYFINLKKAIESRLFDIVAHLDLPKKYGERPKRSMNELVEEVIEALVRHKLCIELNTGGYRKPIKEQYPSLDILRLCYENDIQVTIGSDSHKPEEVGWEVTRALNLLRDIGYSHIVGFENRRKIFYDI
ncbi:MAG: histidinol-phosphatase HisJ family protein [Promethearchaeota archaeon]